MVYIENWVEWEYTVSSLQNKTKQKSIFFPLYIHYFFYKLLCGNESCVAFFGFN